METNQSIQQDINDKKTNEVGGGLTHFFLLFIGFIVALIAIAKLIMWIIN